MPSNFTQSYKIRIQALIYLYSIIRAKHNRTVNIEFRVLKLIPTNN